MIHETPAIKPAMAAQPAKQHSASAAVSGGEKFKRLLAGQGPVISLILLCAVMSFASESFLSVGNMLNILDQVTVLGILAVGMTAIIIIGGIDLSVGSVLAVSMMVMGWMANV